MYIHARKADLAALGRYKSLQVLFQHRYLVYLTAGTTHRLGEMSLGIAITPKYLGTYLGKVDLIK